MLSESDDEGSASAGEVTSVGDIVWSDAQVSVSDRAIHMKVPRAESAGVRL
jgi:hypothetical protein